MAQARMVWADAADRRAARTYHAARPVAGELSSSTRKATHLEQPRVENHELGPLPQLFADQFGWEEMAQASRGVTTTLPPDIRAADRHLWAELRAGWSNRSIRTEIRPSCGSAISGHQNYFLWGPRGYTGESMIVMGDRQDRLETKFASVRKMAHVAHPYSMPYEHIDIFYCQGFKQPLSGAWEKVKNWH